MWKPYTDIPDLDPFLINVLLQEVKLGFEAEKHQSEQTIEKK